MTSKKKSNSYSTLNLQARMRDYSKRYVAIDQFRANAPEAEYFSAFRRFFPLKSSLKDYHGPAFPKTAEQLFSNRVPKVPVNAFREILWSIARSLQFSDELKEFLTRREYFEGVILRGNYAGAVDCLDEISLRFGKSIWLYQNQLAAAYISQNESQPAEVAKQIIDAIQGNKLLLNLFYYIRRRAEGAALRDNLRSEFSQKITSPVYLNYFQAKIFDVTDSGAEAVSSLLFFDSQASVIDHYDSLVRSLQTAVSDEMMPVGMIAIVVHGVQLLYQQTGDMRLFPIVIALGKPYLGPPRIGEAQRAAAIESYTQGDYSSCIETSEDILSKNPRDSAIRLLLIKSLVAIDKRPVVTHGITSDLNDNLYNLLAANEQFYRSVHALLVIADRFIDHSWMLYIRVAVHYEIGSEQNRRLQQWMRDIYVRDQFITPFTAVCISSEHSERLIDSLHAEGLYPSTLALVKETLQPTVEVAEYQTSRTSRYKAREMLANGLYEAAAKLYRLAANEESRTSAKLRALGGESLALMLNGQYQSAVDTLIDAYLSFPHAPTILPIKQLVDGLPELNDWPNTIRLGLLLNLAQQLEDDVDLSVQRLAFEKFCEDNQIASPNDLHQKSDSFGLNLVIEYLDCVWQPEVMRQTLMYSSDDQIDEARIEACRILAQIDLKRAKIHQEELASRIKQQEISKATALVEQSKVYVDIESIKRSLRTRLKTSYAQYKSSLVQHGKPQDDIVKTFETVFSKFDSGASLSLILSNLHVLDSREAPTQADIQFSAIFGEITKEFLTGDHGLNAYLSTRVRHGKFVDALRKSVMDLHLVTPRTADGSYTPNTYWHNQLEQVSTRSELLNILEEFSKKFDDCLIYVRDRKIQIQTYIDLQATEKNAEGLFLYHFSTLERRLVQYYDDDYKDFDELIAKCVDTLWEKTDANLVELRNYLATPLKAQLMQLFDDLSSRTAEQCRDTEVSELTNAVARARTATQQALDNVVAWFKRNEVYDRQDFDIDLPAQIAASMVNRTLSMKTSWHGPKVTILDSDARLPGRSLDALVDIYYALFENAVKYSESEGVALNVRLKLNYQRGAFSGEVLSNALPPSIEQQERLRQIRESLATQESRRLAQSEGRSGFRKIYIALDNPLYKSTQLEFTHEMDGTFRVTFSFKIGEKL